eukprot:scaffold8644_cov115-Isochrysis_galbana.AAC.2
MGASPQAATGSRSPLNPGHTPPRQKRDTGRCTRRQREKACGGQRKARATLAQTLSQTSRHEGCRRGASPARTMPPSSQLGTCICPTAHRTYRAHHSLCCTVCAAQPAVPSRRHLSVRLPRGQWRSPY